MLTKRVIPCFDVADGRVVKGVRFLNLRDAGDPVEMARVYDAEGADELVFYDITASSDEREILTHVVERTADEVFIPFTVGGGLRTVEDMHRMLKAGADKVSINTSAVLDPNLISQGADRFGSQCIVLSIDARRVQPFDTTRPRWEVYTHGGRRPTGMDLLEWAARGLQLGAGEIVMNSIDCDGTHDGYDVVQLRELNKVVDVPVIASGGAGNPQHMYEAVVDGKADAVLAASIFHFGTHPIRQVKEYLAERGVPVRL